MRARAVPLQGPDVKIVAVGDSLTQGTQDATTVKARQDHCYVKQLADHAGLAFNQADLNGEGIPFSIFHDHTFDSRHFYAHVAKLGLAVAPLAMYAYFIGAPPVIIPTWDAVPEMGKRTDESKNRPGHPQQNFAVCGYQLRHVLWTRNMQDYLEEIHKGLGGITEVGTEIPLIRATLGNGESDGDGTALDQAIKQKPDLVVAWAGNNDALSAIFNGRLDDKILTPVEDRQWEYRVSNPITGGSHTVTTDKVMPGFRSQILGKDGLIPRLLKGTTADVMLFNIPDVTVIPNAKEVGKPVGKLPFRVLLQGGTDVTADLEKWVIPDTVKGKGQNGRTHFPPGTRIGLITMMQALLSHGVPKSREELQAAMKGLSLADAESGAAAKGLFGEDDVLDPDELAAVHDRVLAFNQVLEEAAQQNPRVHIVDIHGVLNDAVKNGRALKGDGPDEYVMAGFTGAPDARGRDGIFSYDGVHPSDTGHAVVANVLLDAIRRDLGDNPKFARFKNLSYVDEKKVHHSDPHASQTASAGSSIVLDDHHVGEWMKRAGF
jgi:lysophospholipase L1-like esterase